MADVYVDLDLATGLNDGTSWANAYQTIETALNGSNVSAGDDVWVKGTSGTLSAGTALDIVSSANTNPAKIYGVKSATSNEPPVQSDLIPGWRTGETRTLANRAYKDGDAPLVPHTGNLFVRGNIHVYGVVFQNTSTGTTFFSQSDNCLQVLEECGIDLDDAGNFNPCQDVNSKTILKNCGYDTANTSVEIDVANGSVDFFGLELFGPAVPTNLINDVAGGRTSLIGCDLSAMSGNIFNISGANGGVVILQNSSLHASATVVSGSEALSPYRRELHHCDSITGKTSGTILTIDITTENGNIAEETTAVRTGGAGDGSSNWALAFTPHPNGTRDNVAGLIGSWMAFKISGDGTSQTVTVYIANSGAGDYNDDDVWLEVMYPSEDGTAQYDNQTTQMNLLGTPTAVTDDTESSWGTGGNNPQQLQASIAPDYVGRAYCRVVFAKNFASTPETLYVDPLPVVS